MRGENRLFGRVKAPLGLNILVLVCGKRSGAVKESNRGLLRCTCGCYCTSRYSVYDSSTFNIDPRQILMFGSFFSVPRGRGGSRHWFVSPECVQFSAISFVIFAEIHSR